MLIVSDKVFCEFCNRTLFPVNKIEVILGEEEKYVYSHDDVYHGKVEELDNYIHELQ
jgi:hypothetical protein